MPSWCFAEWAIVLRWFGWGGAIAGLGLGGSGGLALAVLEFRRGQRLGCEGMYYMVKDLVRATGLENFYRQRGRHTFASQLIGHGMDAYLAKALKWRWSGRAF